jgi:hypothetical protein
MRHDGAVWRERHYLQRMREDPGTSDPPVALASSSGALAGAETQVTLPRVSLADEPRASRSRVTVGPLAGRIAIGALIVATFAIVAAASSGPSILVPRSNTIFPNWEAGPLHWLIPRLITDPHTLGLVFSVVVVVMLVAYAAALAAVRGLTMRTIVIAVVVLHLILLLSPPMQLTDLFNYLGYARLGALHHLNPYTHTIRKEVFDPVYAFSSWHNLRSPYGPLFIALTYPLALVSLPIAYWTVKLATVALSLAFVALVWQIARQLGRDPRFPVAFVALNPIFLIYAVEGFHNDFFMLAPMLGAISLVLARRDRAGSGVLLLGHPHPPAAQGRPHRGGCDRGAADRAGPGVVRVLAAQPVAAEHAAHRLQHPQRVRADLRRGGHSRAAQARRDRGGAGGRAPVLPQPRLGRWGRVVDAGPHRQPELADAVVRRVAAAARRAELERPPAPVRRGAHRVPAVRVRARGQHVHQRPQHQPAQHPGRARKLVTSI